jgi:hypothetical protein
MIIRNVIYFRVWSVIIITLCCHITLTNCFCRWRNISTFWKCCLRHCCWYIDVDNDLEIKFINLLIILFTINIIVGNIINPKRDRFIDITFFAYIRWCV